MADKIKFGVGFDIDQSSINSLKQSLESLRKMSVGDVMKINTSNLQDAKAQLETIRTTASTLQGALNKAFNQKLETVNIQTFNKELGKSGLNIQKVYQNLQLAGTQGTTAFRSLANQVTSTNTQLKQTHSLLDKMGETLGNTIKWNIASGAVNKLSGSIQEAYGYVKALDGSLNDIRIVTGKSAESMADFAKQANDAAKNLGTTTTNYTKSALTFYQQGLGDEEVQARAELSNKVSNVTGLSGDQAAEYVTAVLNGYKVGSEEAEAAMDKLAAVAASTASDLAELSEGMSKTASAANAMGVSEDQLAATLSTVISTTRQSAASVGTAFKTIYSRIADIKAGTDEADVSLGEYTGRMAELGFNVLDSEGHLRDLGEVMEEIGGSWANLSREQQIALARTMAGTRQYNNLVALFDNWDDYMKSLNVSMEANGTLQQQQDIYMQSTAAHLKQLSTSMEDVYDSLLDPNAINTLADIFATLANVTADWIDSIGGGTGVLETLGSVAVMVFSRQIARGINTTIENFLVAKNNAEQLRQAMDAVQQFKGIEGLDKTSQQMLDMKDSMYQLSQVMSPESFSAVQNSITGFVDASNQVDTYTNKLELLHNAIQDFDSDNLSEHATEIAANFEDSVQQLEKLHVQVKNVRKALQNVKLGSSNTLGEDLNTATSSMESLIQAAKRMHDTGELTGTTWERMKGAIKEYNTAIAEAQQKGQDLSNNNGAQRAAENLIAVFNGRLSSSIKSTKELMDQLMKEGEMTEDSLSTMLRQAQEEAKKANTDVQTVLQNAARQEIIGNFTKIAGALSSIGFAIQNIKNLGNIWQNDDLTTGEKILQTVTNLATTLPMLISGITAMQAGIKGMAAAKKVYTRVTQEATGAQLSFNAAMLASPWTWVAIAIVAAVAALGAYTQAQKAAIERNREQAAATRDAALAMEEENAQVNDLYNSYKELYHNYNETGEGEDELRQSVLDLADAFNIQIDTLDLLAGKYDKINQKIAETRAEQAKAALDEAQSGLKGATSALTLGAGKASSVYEGKWDIDFSAGAAAMNGEDYNISEYLSSVLQTSIPDLVSQFYKSGTLDQNFHLYGIDSDNFAEVYEAIDTAYSGMMAAAESDADLMSAISKGELDNSIKEWLDASREDYEAYNQLKEDIATYASQFAEAEAALGATAFDVTEITSYEEFEQYRQQYMETLRQVLSEEGIEKSEAELKELADEYLGTIDYISDYVKTASVEDSLLDKMLAGIDENDTAGRDAVKNFVDGLSEEDLKIIATIGIDERASVEEVQKGLAYAQAHVDNGIGIENANAINTVMASYNNDKRLTKDQQAELEYAQSVLDVYLETAEGILGMETAAEEWAMVSEQGTLAQIEYLQDLADREGEYATKTEEDIRNELQLKLEYLNTEKARLTDEAAAMDALGEKVQAYEALKQKPDFNANSEEAKAIFESAEAYDEAAEKCRNYRADVEDVGAAIKEVTETLDGGIDFEVDMSNVEEILSVGDTILSEAEKIKSAAELIGEGFTVAAEDADKLAAVFPEILENATVTADGVIHLDQQTVNALLGGQEAILNGDVNTAIAKIDNQIAILQAKKEAAEAELEIANALAEAEVGITEEQTRILADGQKQLTDYLVQLGVDEADAQKAVAEAMAGNMEEYSRIVGDKSDEVSTNLAGALASAANSARNNSSNMITSFNSVINAAHQMAAAIAAAGEGEEAGSTSGPAGGGGDSSTDFSSTTNNSGFKGTTPHKVSTDNIHLDNWQDQLLGDISGYTNAIAELTALKAKLLANQKNAQAALDGANSGLGGKTDKDKGGNNKKDKESDFIEALADEYDAYHDINIEIQEIERSLSKLQKAQDRLTGKELIDNLNKQLELIQKQRDAYADKIELAKMEAGAYKSALTAYGATFDAASGQLTNYYSLLQNQLNKTNEVIARYNSLAAEAQTEEEKQKVEDAKKQYEQLKQLIDSYEDTINNVIPELQEQIEDALYQEIEIQIAKFDMQVQLRLDMTEAEQDWNQFKRKVIDGIDDDDLTGKANQSYNDIVSHYNANNTGMGSVQTRTNQVNTILGELEAMNNGGHSSIYSAYDENTGTWVDDKARAEEDLKKAYSGLMDDLESIEDLEDSVRDAFLESIDAVDAAFDKQRESYEFVNAQIEHDIKMMELMYGDEAYDKMDSYYEKQIQNTKAELAAQQESAAYWKKKMDAEKAAIANGGGDKEALAKYEENWKESISNVNTLLENWAEQVTQKYENTIDNMIDSLNDKVSNGLGLEYLDEELSLLNDNADNYLDTINAAYAKQKLSNKWQDAIDNTDSISAQRELNDLMQQQMDMLEKKGQLTQYDIDRAEKEYEIALKQIALQEAQQNKSKMRLKRDANGNYSYQFVSDEDSIKDAEQELAAAQNELYNFDKSAYQNNLNEMYATWNEFQQKIAEAYKTYAGDQDALNEHIALLQEQYGEKINFLTEQNLGIRNNLTDSAITELAGIYGTDVENFQKMTEDEKNLIMNDLVPQWDSGVQQMMDKFAGEGGFEEVCQTTFDNLSNAADEYQTDMDAIRDKNQEVSDEAYQEGQQLIEQSQELIQAADEEYERVGMVMEQVNQLRDAYYDAKQAAIEATQAAYNYVQASSAMGAAAAAGGSSGGGSNGGSSSGGSSGGGSSSGGSSSGGSSGNGGGSGSKGSNGTIDVGDKGTFRGKYYYDSYGTAPAGSLYSGVPNGVVVDMKNGNPYGIHIHSADGRYGDLGWIKKSQLTGYDTGGYTGSWNSTGRLALLHQKELVLNAKDTSNMLNAVSILRDVVDNIGENALSRTAAMLSGLGIISNNGTGGDNLEQTVYITASFEGQTEADQIETALNNLVNIAAQRANRNKR